MTETSIPHGGEDAGGQAGTTQAARVDSAAADNPRLRRAMRRLDRLVRHAPLDRRALRVRLRRNGAAYEARAVLILPTDTLVGRGEGNDSGAAFAEAINWLASELCRRNELARREAVAVRRRTRQRDITGANGFLVYDHAREDDSTFIDLFRPLLRHVRDHAHHELVIAQLEGSLEVDAATDSDVLDEVLVRAWSRFGDRPRDRALDEWMVSLVHDVVDGYSEHDSPEASSRRTPAADQSSRPVAQGEAAERYAAQAGWMAEGEPYWGAPTRLVADDLLPGAEPSELLVGLAAEGEQRVLLDLLSAMPRARRRAFMLSTLDGYTDDEIGRILRRTTADVRADIASARELLRERLTDAV